MKVWVNVFFASYNEPHFRISSRTYDTEEEANTGAKKQERSRRNFIGAVQIEVPTSKLLEHPKRFPWPSNLVLKQL